MALLAKNKKDENDRYDQLIELVRSTNDAISGNEQKNLLGLKQAIQFVVEKVEVIDAKLDRITQPVVEQPEPQPQPQYQQPPPQYYQQPPQQYYQQQQPEPRYPAMDEQPGPRPPPKGRK